MNRQQRKSKKHPLIRAIRGIVRLLRVIFSPARSKVRLKPIAHPEIDPAQIERAELERSRILAAQQRELARERELAERYITVGALLERVQWQFPEPTILDTPATTKLDILPRDVYRN